MPAPFQGCVLAMRGQDIVHEQADGLADAAAGVPCAAGTRFQLASVSKQFTAAAVLLLAENGALSLDQPVRRWLPGCPASWEAITLHHLLCHASGLGHWEDYPEIDLRTWMDPADLLATFQRRPPTFLPGNGFAYSSPGYVLLAQVVQQVSDEPYRTFLERRVFAPAGLSDTFVGAAAPDRGIAVGYDGSQVAEPFELDAVGMGAGDVWSTVGDVLRWVDALRDGAVLSSRSLAAMFARHADAATLIAETAYGYGWFLGPLAGRAARYHTGDNSGFKSLSAWFPETGLRFVALTNQYRTEEFDVERLLETVAGAE